MTPKRLASISADRLRAQNLDVLNPESWYERGFIPGQSITPEMKAEACHNEEICFPLDMTIKANQYASTGTYPEYIKTAAQLGNSDLALLTSQVIAGRKKENCKTLI